MLLSGRLLLSLLLLSQSPAPKGELAQAKAGGRKSAPGLRPARGRRAPQAFRGNGREAVQALTERYGFAGSDVLVRFGTEKESADGPSYFGARGLSNREGIAADVELLRKKLSADDTLWVIVIGHAYYDGRHSHLNIPGPDLDEREFGKLFEGLKSREQVFFITTPASGFYVKPLAASGRVVIAATEADQEVNETLFPHALAEELATPSEGIDRDKDGKISASSCMWRPSPT